ncbi:MAG: hypothetical protein ACXAE3_11770 [Candidatus Kariarchaeaceae archaeon]
MVTLSPPMLGIITGLLACIVFNIFHQITISNIWNMSAFMLPVSALAGFTLLSSYGVLYGDFVTFTFSIYIVYHTLSLTALSLVSVIVFTPRYNSATVINDTGGAPPPQMIRDAFPLTIAWMLVSTIVIVLLVNPTLVGFLSTLAASATLFLTLGLNLSILGLVELEPQHRYLVHKFLAMNVGLGLSFLVIYLPLDMVL